MDDAKRYCIRQKRMEEQFEATPKKTKPSATPSWLTSWQTRNTSEPLRDPLDRSQTQKQVRTALVQYFDAYNESFQRSSPVDAAWSTGSTHSLAKEIAAYHTVLDDGEILQLTFFNMSQKDQPEAIVSIIKGMHVKKCMELVSVTYHWCYDRTCVGLGGFTQVLPGLCDCRCYRYDRLRQCTWHGLKTRC